MKVKLLVLSLLFTTTLFAQFTERNALKASFGISGHGKEQVQTPTLLLAFNKDFYPKTFVEINAAWLLPVDVSEGEDELLDLQSFRFGMNFLYKVLDLPKQSFNVGLGFSGGLYSTKTTVLATQASNTEAEFSPGFSAVVEYAYILPSQWLFGIRGSVSRFDSDRSQWFLGGVLGYKF